MAQNRKEFFDDVMPMDQATSFAKSGEVPPRMSEEYKRGLVEAMVSGRPGIIPLDTRIEEVDEERTVPQSENGSQTQNDPKSLADVALSVTRSTRDPMELNWIGIRRETRVAVWAMRKLRRQDRLNKNK